MNKSTNVALIRLEDGKYPVRFAELRKEFPNVSFPGEFEDELMEEFGYAVVHPTVREDNVDVVEGTPEFVDGKYVQTWVAREYTAEEVAERLKSRKDVMLSEIEQMTERAFEIGYPHQFPNGMVEYVQLRVKDQAALQRLLVQAAREADKSSPHMQFRTAENNIHSMSALELQAMIAAAFDHAEEISIESWLLKDSVREAESLESLPTLPSALMMK